MATAIRELASLDEWMVEWGDLSNEIKEFKVCIYVSRHFTLQILKARPGAY